ncbi:MAG: ATP-binding cassette domain-containing protein [Spirochaetia bacterium]
MGILKVRDLTLKMEEKPILNHLDIDFWQGHIHAIVGPNGAGKSTFAHTLMGLQGYTHHTGSILFKGREVGSLPVNERAAMGMTLAWQEPARFEGLKVRTFVSLGAQDKSEKSVAAALNTVGLFAENYMDRALDKTLSGGERKRIEVASILAMGPDLVIMDEPDSGVDIEAIQNIFSAIEELKNRGTTIIMITHSAEVLKRADHAFLLCHGSVVDKGSINKMKAYFEGKCIPCTHKNRPETEVING